MSSQLQPQREQRQPQARDFQRRSGTSHDHGHDHAPETLRWLVSIEVTGTRANGRERHGIRLAHAARSFRANGGRHRRRAAEQLSHRAPRVVEDMRCGSG